MVLVLNKTCPSTEGNVKLKEIGLRSYFNPILKKKKSLAQTQGT